MAAGMSRRMGEPKLLLKLGSKTIIEHVMDNVTGAGVSEVIAVLGAERGQISELLSKYDVKLIYNPRYSAGQGTSVAAGASAASAWSRGIMFLMGDQPLISSGVINYLIDCFINTRPLILRPRGAGNPTVFDIKLRRELMQLSGDVGGRQVIEKYRTKVTHVPLFPRLLSMDIDTREDYRKILHLWEKGNFFSRR
nr:nucleotidyltransferase family protein [Desulforadius tongensis]